jgi:effector-binding domain-containing protein
MKRLVALVLLLSVTTLFAQTAEKKEMPAPAKAKSVVVGEITVKTIPAMTAATVMEKAADFAPKEGYKAGMEGAGQAFAAMPTDGFKKLGDWIKGGGMPTGPAFGTYYEDPSKTPAKDLTAKFGFPTMKDSKGNDIVKIEQIPETQAAVVQFSGPYEGSGEVYGALMKWIPEHGFQYAGPPTEVYLKGVHDKVPPAEYLTEIRFPVTKIEAPKAADEKKVEAPKAEGGK